MNASDLIDPPPAVAPLQALAAIAHAPIIVGLFGEKGTTIAWDDDPSVAILARLPSVPNGQALTTHVAEDTWGKTWGHLSAGATFVQLDYEWPTTPARILRPRYMAQWDEHGAFRVSGPNGSDPTALVVQLMAPHPPLPSVQFSAPLTAQWSAAEHAKRVARIREFIASGDCYQANLTMPFTATLCPGAHRDIALFTSVMNSSPAPFAGFFRSPDRPSIISHSPECFMSQRGSALVSVPIKGTRRRQPGQEHAIRNELAQAPKDAAELAMIVDLVRNDLGHVAQPGSVRVSNHGHFIDLTYVHHRAARIEATLRNEHNFHDVVQAAFPAGSITGAPKLRAMEILAALEGTPRGAYCGVFGWIGAHSADLAVAIRTASISAEHVLFHAGGGIVWDSEAPAEWDEVHAKAAGFATAIGAWA